MCYRVDIHVNRSSGKTSRRLRAYNCTVKSNARISRDSDQSDVRSSESAPESRHFPCARVRKMSRIHNTLNTTYTTICAAGITPISVMSPYLETLRKISKSHFVFPASKCSFVQIRVFLRNAASLNTRFRRASILTNA